MKLEQEDINEAVVALDTYNSDLNLVIDASKYSAHPLTNEGFAFMWAGVRATHGAAKGKICFEVKILEHLDVSHLPADEPNPNVVRVGVSVESSPLQLGEDPLSYGYGGTGKISTNCQFKDFGGEFTAGDTILCAVNFESDQVQIGYAKNGKFLGWAFRVNKPELKAQALFPHVLTKNCSFEVNFGQKQKPYFDLPEAVKGYTFIGCLPQDQRIGGTRPPKQRQDCEMIMMCGLPGAGKSVWAAEYSSKHPDKKYNVLGTNNIIDKMKVMGLPRKRNYAGRWDVLIQMATKCLNKMFEIGSKLRRNYILDQTNVYPTAQRRKMRNFEGFKRTAVVVVPSEEEYRRRCDKRDREEGKEIPDQAVLEMKANFKLPEVGDTFDDVIFTELQREEAEKLVANYNEEGRIALGPSKKMFRPNDADGNKGFDSGRGNFISNRGGSSSPYGGFDGGRGGRGGYGGNRGGFDGGKDDFGNRGFDRGRGGFGGRGGYMGGRGDFDGGRGGFDSGRGGFDGGRGGFDSGRGYSGGRGGYEGGRGGFDGSRGGFNSGRGSFDGGRGGFESGRGGRGGFESGRGGRGGFNGGRGGFDSGRGSFDGGRGSRGDFDGGRGGRGGFDGGRGSRGGFDGGRGSRGGFDGGRGSRGGFEGGRGSRGGFEGGRGSRGGFDSGRGGFDSGRGGFEGGRGGHDGDRGHDGGRGGFGGGRGGRGRGNFGGRGSFDGGRGARGGFGSGRGSFESGRGNINRGGFDRKRGYDEGPGNNSGGYGDYDSRSFNDSSNTQGNFGRGGSRGRGSGSQSGYSSRDYNSENNQDRHFTDSGKDSHSGSSNLRNQSNSRGGNFNARDNSNSSGSNTGSNFNSRSNYSNADYGRSSSGNYDSGYSSYGDFSEKSQGGFRTENYASRDTSRSFTSSSAGTFKKEPNQSSEGSNVDTSNRTNRNTVRASGRTSRWSAETTPVTTTYSQTPTVTTVDTSYVSYGAPAKTEPVASTGQSQYDAYSTYVPSNPPPQAFPVAPSYGYQPPPALTTTMPPQQWPAAQPPPPPPPIVNPAGQVAPDQTQWAQYYQQAQPSQYYSQYYGQPAAAAPAAYTPAYGTK